MAMADTGCSRRIFLKGSGYAAAGLLFGGSLVGCTSTGGGGGDPLESARQEGRVRVGIAGEAPYGFTDQAGRVTGQAPEAARAVVRKRGNDAAGATQGGVNQVIPAVNARRLDVVAAGMLL